VSRQHFEVFTQRHGDVVFTTRFRFVARLVTRFVRTLEYDYPIPLVPVEQIDWDGVDGDEGEQEYDARICPDCGHDYYHDAQGRCMQPMGFGEEARVCGWHPDVMGPVSCEGISPKPRDNWFTTDDAQVDEWGERGVCQSCGEAPATKLIPAVTWANLSALKVCNSCAKGEVTVALSPAPSTSTRWPGSSSGAARSASARHGRRSRPCTPGSGGHASPTTGARWSCGSEEARSTRTASGAFLRRSKKQRRSWWSSPSGRSRRGRGGELR
jgi:hypothetical protein